TDQDNRATVARHAAPIVEHEVGQWAVYPRMAEIPKYDGVLRARNFERIREDLRAKGLLGQAEEFTQASGKLSALLYKEEIERLLRTPGQAGFALLDLHDFPGQGTALVGVLDPFWDSKGFITPEQWRRFCAPTVPLLRLPKRAYTTAETLSASADIAHYGPQDLTDARPEWSVRDQRGRVVASGSWPALQLKTGELTHLGSLQVPFQGLDAPVKLTVTIGLAGTTVANDWEAWVYPVTSEEEPKGITISQSWDEATRKTLASGGRVLLQVTRPSGNIRGRFTPLFWSPVWFRDQPLTMGMLCQPSHPAFGLFPTEAQTNWQWYDLLNDARCLVVDDLPRGLRPISQAVDAFTRNHKLAYLFEARVGSGRLLVSSLDLSRDLDQRPAARQLRRSLLAYMASDAFRPQQALSETELEPALSSGPASQMSRLGAKVVSVDSEAPGFGASRLLDDNPDTLWHTDWEGPRPPFPHQVTVDLGAPRVLKAVLCLPRQDQSNGWVRDYAIYLSSDGVTWGPPIARGSFARDADLKRIPLPTPTSARYLRFEALSGFDSQPFASMAELDVVVQ
ncbi:MAG TPA: discoidin domain-containing protein, partial [Armatimonadota bacterium]